MKSEKPKIVVGVSGGVDSAVALLLLKKQGFEPIAVSLRFSGWQGKDNIYSNQETFKTAARVCRKLKIPFKIIDCRRQFKEKVIGYFIKELKRKRTPNPCVVCNQQLKFKALLDFAEKNKIDYVATGHYARLRKKGGQYQLLKGKDKTKDQSYFLCLLTQKELKKIIFPLGDLTKKEVCRIAEKNGLDFVLKRKPSQDICFVSRKSLPLLLEKKIGFEPGEIIDSRGNVLGEHKGLHFYTIGQRKGLNIPKGPWWALGFNREKNQLIVANKESELYSRSAVVSSYYFISGKTPKKAIKVRVKCRYNQPAVSAVLSLCHFPSCHSRISLCHSRASGNPGSLNLDSRVNPPIKLEDGSENDTKKNRNDAVVKLTFHHPQKAIAPGQWAVFYQGDVCLGGGIIKSGNNEQGTKNS